MRDTSATYIALCIYDSRFRMKYSNGIFCFHGRQLAPTHSHVKLFIRHSLNEDISDSMFHTGGDLTQNEQWNLYASVHPILIILIHNISSSHPQLKSCFSGFTSR